ncbi:hypothetical protein PLESTB_001466700 [Pleodorina starrii]|uniref:Uncharacterized protein n=1 Tax=Pleodorina starrii TaxID=330485 RepID=A0A9W6BVZ8_9CHLO|nr:hypothetical protein PLESTM_001684900 [Pleodorina starrii]GLC59252.1 hypothetical protein PLESTB_001466700 [Pleodorina starrii]GLC74817.1 hypothetical protein PLESTF_001559300 [Pleodorina starrii]
MQLSGPLRASGSCLHGKRVPTARATWLSGLGVSHHGRPVRVAASSENSEAPSAGPNTGNVAATDQQSNAIDVHAHAIVPSVEAVTSDRKPTAATSATVEGDWLEPPPGDWGGTVDRQAIKEPDSSGVLFYFIIIAGLSLGVHQLLKLLGARQGEGQLTRPSARQVAVVAAPTYHAKLPQPSLLASKPEASAEDSAAEDSAATALAETRARSATEAGAGDGGAKAADAAGAATAASAAQRGPEGEVVRGSVGPAGPSSALTSASETEPGNEMDAESEDVATEQSEPATMRLPPQQAVSGPGSQASVFVSSAGPSEGDQASSSGAAKTLQQVPVGEDRAGSASGAAGPPAAESQALNVVVGPASQAPPRAAQPSGQDTTADSAAGSAAQPLLASTSAGGSSGGLGGARAPAEQQASPAPATSTGATSSPAAWASGPFAGGSAFFMGGGGAPAAPQPEPVAPARVSLPSVRPEPLSRAPDSSALAMLPNDDSLSSLRERAQLSLRGAAAAVEASQRAAAYAAAASSAASRAAEAAERAAAAATSAQAGLESAAESAIVAAEARVAQAAEAAKEAEGRAASAAAHATAYQDMAQSQADIAERAAAVQKPAALPGPLSQLQQLWRSASSAFAHGHQHSHEESSRGGQSDGSIVTVAVGSGGGSSTNDSSARGNGNTADAGGTGTTAGRMGTAAAETISSTVKGFISWLGQGDGTR